MLSSPNLRIKMSLPDSIKSVDSADVAPKAAWTKQDLFVVAAVWHLYTSGITEVGDINRLLGTSIHGSTIKSIVSGCGRLINGPIGLKEPVRCNYCGGSILSIPCRLCFDVPITNRGAVRLTRVTNE